MWMSTEGRVSVAIVAMANFWSKAANSVLSFSRKMSSRGGVCVPWGPREGPTTAYVATGQQALVLVKQTQVLLLLLTSVLCWQTSAVGCVGLAARGRVWGLMYPPLHWQNWAAGVGAYVPQPSSFSPVLSGGKLFIQLASGKQAKLAWIKYVFRWVKISIFLSSPSKELSCLVQTGRIVHCNCDIISLTGRIPVPSSWGDWYCGKTGLHGKTTAAE